MLLSFPYSEGVTSEFRNLRPASSIALGLNKKIFKATPRILKTFGAFSIKFKVTPRKFKISGAFSMKFHDLAPQA